MVGCAFHVALRDHGGGADDGAGAGGRPPLCSGDVCDGQPLGLGERAGDPGAGAGGQQERRAVGCAIGAPGDPVGEREGDDEADVVGGRPGPVGGRGACEPEQARDLCGPASRIR